MLTVGDLDIRSGGLVAVDTASLRRAAGRLEATADDLDDVERLLRRAVDGIEAVPRADRVGALLRARGAQEQADRLAREARRIAGLLRELAAMFETVELRAERSLAEAGGDWPEVERLDARLAQLEREHPWAAMRASWDELARSTTWAGSLVGQAAMVGTLLSPAGALGAGLLVWGLGGALRAAGNGTVGGADVLGGAPRPVALRELPTSGARAAPATLAAAAGRIPSAEGSRIRVERYAMPDGTRQYAVYIRGTTAGGDDEAFDMDANLRLYGGDRSASYEATLAALREAGAEPGDVVHAFGHSQGAMIAGRVAVEGGFDTQTLVTFGSPVDTQVGDGTLSVAVRHSDDPVVALAGGGFDGGVGAPGSFVAERTVDPTVSLNDVDVAGAHHLTRYEDTAAMLDASTDPRMDAVRDRLARLGEATSVTVSEYAVSELDPGPDAPACR